MLCHRPPVHAEFTSAIGTSLASGREQQLLLAPATGMPKPLNIAMPGEGRQGGTLQSGVPWGQFAREVSVPHLRLSINHPLPPGRSTAVRGQEPRRRALCQPHAQEQGVLPPATTPAQTSPPALAPASSLPWVFGCRSLSHMHITLPWGPYSFLA